MRRMVRGSAFIILGTLIVIGVAIAFLSYSDEIKSTGQRSVVGLIIMGVMGVGAIGKGVFGLVFGQFLGDDD